MTATISNGNGRLHSKDERIEVLPFLDADKNVFLRGSVGSAWTDCKSTGNQALACQFQEELVEAIKRRRPEGAVDLDAFTAAALLQSAGQRLEGLPDLVDVAAGSLLQRGQALRDLASRRPVKLVRQVQEYTQAVVSDALQSLEASLIRQFQEAPFSCSETFDAVAQALRDLTLPTTDGGAQKRFFAGTRALSFLERSAALPPKLRASLVADLTKRCDAEFQAAWEGLLREYLAESLRQSVVTGSRLLEELRRRQLLLRQNAEAIAERLHEQHKLARQRSVSSQSSVLLELAAPEPAEILAAIRNRFHCEDRAGLIRLFQDRLELKLEGAARARYPLITTPARLADYWTQMPLEEVATVVEEIVSELTAGLHSVYTAVRAFGVRQAAQELYERAAPLCGLSSRDHVGLNVEPHSDLVVRLPVRRSPDDEEVAEKLRAEFRLFAPAAQFVEEAVDSEITVIRTLVGFPIGIEEANAAMLADYAASSRQGHHPHLFDILPDTDGRPLPQLVALAQHRHQP
jgi:hypothetical protein